MLADGFCTFRLHFDSRLHRFQSGKTYGVLLGTFGMECLAVLLMLAGQEVSLYSDDKKMQPQLKLQKIKTDGSLQLTVQPQGGAVIVE